MAAHHVDELCFAAQTAAAWPIAQITRPGIQSRRPRPTAAASVPLAIAMPRLPAPARCAGCARRETASDQKECTPMTAPARHGREMRPMNGDH